MMKNMPAFGRNQIQGQIWKANGTGWYLISEKHDL